MASFMLRIVAPIDGHWGRWSSWSSCSETCDNGNQQRSRKCDDPPRKNAGNFCYGDPQEQRGCIVRRCGLGKRIELRNR